MTALQMVQITRRVDPHLSIDRYDPEGELMLLHFGPQHPSTHGVFRMDLYLDWERVVKVVPTWATCTARWRSAREMPATCRSPPSSTRMTASRR